MKRDYMLLAKEIVMKYIDVNNFDVFLFGSRAEGNYHDRSDIDIGIIGKEPLDGRKFSDLSEELEESIIPYKVDVIDFFSVGEKFKAEAMKHVVYWNRASQNHNSSTLKL